MCTKLNEKVKTNGPKLEIVYRNPKIQPKVGFQFSTNESQNHFKNHVRHIEWLVRDIQRLADGSYYGDKNVAVRSANTTLEILTIMGKSAFFSADFNRLAKTV